MLWISTNSLSFLFISWLEQTEISIKCTFFNYINSFVCLCREGNYLLTMYPMLIAHTRKFLFFFSLHSLIYLFFICKFNDHRFIHISLSVSIHSSDHKETFCMQCTKMEHYLIHFPCNLILCHIWWHSLNILLRRKKSILYVL